MSNVMLGIKSISEAKPGEFCYYDLSISDEEMLKPEILGEHIEYAKRHVQSENVMIINIEPTMRYEDHYQISVIRFKCVKLAEPDISKMRKKFKK